LSARALRRRGRLNDRASSAGLCHGLWSRRRLYTLTGGDRDAARDDRGGGYAKSGSSDEVTAGDDRPSMFFSWLRTDWLRRQVTC